MTKRKNKFAYLKNLQSLMNRLCHIRFYKCITSHSTEISFLFSFFLGFTSSACLINDSVSGSRKFSEFLTPIGFLFLILDTILRIMGILVDEKRTFLNTPKWNLRAQLLINFLCFWLFLIKICFRVSIDDFILNWPLILKPFLILFEKFKSFLYILDLKLFKSIILSLTVINIVAQSVFRIVTFHGFNYEGTTTPNESYSLQLETLFKKARYLVFTFLVSQSILFLIVLLVFNTSKNKSTKTSKYIASGDKFKFDVASDTDGLNQLKAQILLQNKKIQTLLEEKIEILHSILEFSEQDSNFELLSSSRHQTVLGTPRNSLPGKSIFFECAKGATSHLGDLPEEQIPVKKEYTPLQHTILSVPDQILVNNNEEEGFMSSGVGYPMQESSKSSAYEKGEFINIEEDERFSIDFFNQPGMEVIVETQNELSSSFSSILHGKSFSNNSMCCSSPRLPNKFPRTHLINLKARPQMIKCSKSFDTSSRVRLRDHEICSKPNSPKLPRLEDKQCASSIRRDLLKPQVKDDLHINYSYFLNQGSDLSFYELTDSIIIRKR